MKIEVVRNQQKEKGTRAVDPKWTLNELVLKPETLSALEDVCSFFENRERILREWNFQSFLKNGAGVCVNFSGPSGTGKTSTAEALANRLHLKIIKADIGDVMSSALGGSLKLLTELMSEAESSGCLLLFDEADNLLGARLASATQAADHEINSLKGRLLTRLDSYKGLIVFATNFPAGYDAAFKRRIMFQLHFPLPSVEQRCELWIRHLARLPHSLSIDNCAAITDGFSGGDIKTVAVRLAARLSSKGGGSIDETVFSTLVEEHMSRWDDSGKKMELDLSKSANL